MSGDLNAVWLIGAGRMAIAYAKVLKALDCNMHVVGRSKAGADEFTRQTGVPCLTGGVAAHIDTIGAAPSAAIVAVSVNELADTVMALIGVGVLRILVEKPAGVTPKNIAEVNTAASRSGASVYVAYNRRFYAATEAVCSAIREDGGASFVTFEFTEVADSIAKSAHPANVKENWLLANSSHVIDLAFFFAGEPTELHADVDGSLDWHPAAARFAGAGRTDRNALFSYMADWDAPGRWGVEVMTRRRRLIMRPMEQLHVQVRGGFSIEPVDIDYMLDREFKPGLYLQTQAFLQGAPDERLLDIKDHLRRVTSIYEPIGRGIGGR